MEQPPTQLFELYEADFKVLLSNIKDKLDTNGKDWLGGVYDCAVVPRLSYLSSLEQRKAALRKVEIELDEADDIVRSFRSPRYYTNPHLCRYPNLKSRFRAYLPQFVANIQQDYDRQKQI
jgi:vesicle transport through interaction with t-SNAREs protein 1